MTAPLAIAFAAAITLAPAAALAAPPAWVVDYAHSHIAFSSAATSGAFTGIFRRWNAVIHFDPKDLAHSDIAATIDMASAATVRRHQCFGRPALPRCSRYVTRPSACRDWRC